jgi:hypothetical protein
MAVKLAIPEIPLELPDLPEPAGDGATPKQIALTKTINDFSKTALENNSTNLTKSVGFVQQSFDWLRIAYTAILIVGLLTLLAAVAKALFANNTPEAVAAGVLGAASLGAILSSTVLKPTESMERNAIFIPWMLLVLNTYWTRLVYMNDPTKIDAQLEDAAKDASEQFKAISEALAGALKTENERLVALAGPASSDGKAEGGKDKSKDAGAGGPAPGQTNGQADAPPVK